MHFQNEFLTWQLLSVLVIINEGRSPKPCSSSFLPSRLGIRFSLSVQNVVLQANTRVRQHLADLLLQSIYMSV